MYHQINTNMKQRILLVAIAIIGILFPKASNAQWTIDSLPTAQSNLQVVQLSSKAIFASTGQYEMYDFNTGMFTYSPVSIPRNEMKAVVNSGRAFFGGGVYGPYTNPVVTNRVDIYNNSTNSWTTTNLSLARRVGAAEAAGNKVIFAGGKTVLSYTSRVDIIDVFTGSKLQATLSQGRHNMASASIGSKVIFAGGECGNIGTPSTSNKVDIYDVNTKTWDTTLLSQKRQYISSAVVGSKVLFAGGFSTTALTNPYSDRVDIYDTITNTWTTASMSEGKYGMTVAVVGKKVYFVGGVTASSGNLSSRVEIYNAITNSWSFVTLSSPRMGMAVAKTTGRLMFAGGVTTWGNVGTDRVEVLNLKTNQWSVEYLSQPRLGVAAAAKGTNAIFVGGAQVWSSYPIYSIISNRIDKWTDLVPAMKVVSTSKNANEITVFPNPSSGSSVDVKFEKTVENAVVSIVDVTGKELISMSPASEVKELNIDISQLTSGMYFVIITGTDYRISKPLIVNR